MILIAELRRRNVIKVAGAYLALAWVIVQFTGAVVPALNLPSALVPMVIWIGVIGFPCVLIFSWVYELTPEGLKRESEIDRSQSITHITSKRLDYIIIALMVLAILMFAADRLIPRSTDPAVGAGHARDSSADSETDRAQGALTQHAPTPAPDEKSIAVLPFVNMSSDKEQEYFSDGISEELLNLLAKVPELRVIARTSSFAFKGEKLEIGEIAKRLNVAHVLEGSVRKSGNTVRITAQLVRAADSTHLWSETWDRPLDNIFAVQDEIAGAVVEQLKIKLLGAALKAKEVNPQAYALFLQARQLRRQGTADSIEQAIALNKQALALEPGYAAAWDDLARAYSNQAGNGATMLFKGDAEAALAEARKEPDENIRLYTLALVYHALGRQAEADAALAGLMRKYEKASSYLIASVLSYRNELDRAFEWLDKAVANHDAGLSSLATAETDPTLDNARKDPRWLPFLQKLGKSPEQLAAIPFEVKLPQ